MRSNTRKEVNCVGGPYHGRRIHLSYGCDSTLWFRVKSWFGKYSANGVWVNG